GGGSTLTGLAASGVAISGAIAGVVAGAAASAVSTGALALASAAGVLGMAAPASGVVIAKGLASAGDVTSGLAAAGPATGAKLFGIGCSGEVLKPCAAELLIDPVGAVSAGWITREGIAVELSSTVGASCTSPVISPVVVGVAVAGAAS